MINNFGITEYVKEGFQSIAALEAASDENKKEAMNLRPS